MKTTITLCFICLITLFYYTDIKKADIKQMVLTEVKNSPSLQHHYPETVAKLTKKIAISAEQVRHQQSIVKKPPPTKLNYAQKKQQLALARKKLAHSYKKATNNTQKNHVLNQARHTFIHGNTALAAYWYGTPWQFHGTSQTPQKGSIACGYFVTTVLAHMGLKVQRAKLAQQASENIIKSLTTEKYIKRFHHASLATFITAIKDWGKGLYVVGLDYHVGIIWHDGKNIHFIHATYVQPKTAFSEPAASSAVLAASKYRVIGKISADNQLLKKWLMQQRINTKT